MVRISKLADYAVVITQWLADQTGGCTIEDIATGTRLPVATVRKLTRLLTQADICMARKGPGGGYRLARMPKDISLLCVVEAVEGKITLTDCVRQTECDCTLMPGCQARGGWQVINRIIRTLFAELSMADLAEDHLGSSSVMVHLMNYRPMPRASQQGA